jgi:hypothetical protein
MKILSIRKNTDWPAIISRMAGVALLVAGVLLAAGLCAASPHDNPVPSIFETHSTPADSIGHLSHFVLGVTATIFLVVFSLCRGEIPPKGGRRGAVRRYSPRAEPSVKNLRDVGCSNELQSF